MLGHAARDEQIGQDLDHVRRFELGRDLDGQTCAGELVDDVEQLELAPIMGLVLDND